MDVSPSVERMIAVLKLELRARGIRNRDIASRLGVSEITVKRYLSGRGLALTALERLAGLVDLDVLTLALLAKQQRASTPELNKAQQALLTRDPLASRAFMLLLRDWDAPRIARELDLTNDEVQALFVKMEQLSLIRRVSDISAIVLARPNIKGMKDSQLMDLWRESALSFLRNIDLFADDCEWIYYGFRLSSQSSTKVKDLINEFVDEVRLLDKSDSDLPPEDVKWHRIFVGCQPSGRDLVDRE